jgi:hypothetical protein
MKSLKSLLLLWFGLAVGQLFATPGNPPVSTQTLISTFDVSEGTVAPPTYSTTFSVTPYKFMSTINPSRLQLEVAFTGALPPYDCFDGLSDAINITITQGGKTLLTGNVMAADLFVIVNTHQPVTVSASFVSGPPDLCISSARIGIFAITK